MKTSALAEKMAVQFNGKTYPVESIAQAQNLWDKVRDEAINGGLSSRDLSADPVILVNGIGAGYLSWNGRAWKINGAEWL